MARKPTSGHIYRPSYTYKGQRVQSTVWWIKFYVRGVPMRESAKTDSWDEAARLLKRRQGEVVTGRFVGTGPERIKMGQLLQVVGADYMENGRKSLLDVQVRNKLHLIPAFGEVRVADLTTGHLKRYIKARLKDGARNGTINRELAIVSRGFHLAAAEDPPLVLRIPHIPKLPEDNVREGFLDLERYKRVRDELPAHLRPLFTVAYHTGARCGELRKIRWDQVDLKAKQIYVSRLTTKNRDAHTLPIYGEMGPWLEMAKTERDIRFPDCPWVFFDETGSQIGTFRKAWMSACERAGVPGLLFHDLRRSAAMTMDRAGVPRRVIMQITGHKTEAMFLRYRIVSSRDLRDAAVRLENFMSRPPAVQAQSVQESAIQAPDGQRIGQRGPKPKNGGDCKLLN